MKTSNQATNTELSDRMIAFMQGLNFTGNLPEGYTLMNPFRQSRAAEESAIAFTRKYYTGNQPRTLVLGINPGRFGAGHTGICFTDPKRLQRNCSIPFEGPLAHEPSSEFFYQMIDCFGGPVEFYSLFLVSAVCPLGLTRENQAKRQVNCNYYDNRNLTQLLQPFIVDSLMKHVELGINTKVCICLGTGKNHAFLESVNSKYRFFNQVVSLEHPRYIMQYRLRQKQSYIEKYLRVMQNSRP